MLWFLSQKLNIKHLGNGKMIFAKFKLRSSPRCFPCTAGAIYCTVFLYFSPPIAIKGLNMLLQNTTHEVKFSFRLEHVINVDKYFNLLTLFGLISSIFLGTVMVGVDSMFVLCIQHVCALFEYIR